MRKEVVLTYATMHTSVFRIIGTWYYVTSAEAHVKRYHWRVASFW